ncbi:MAG: SDR family oxidoreductase [Actinobacteria bacterium]|nr:SDR family oxidoreductase [Actinomycetota bacterium]
MSLILAEKGAWVALAARSSEKLLKLASGLKNSFAIPCDMTETGSIKNMVKEIYSHYGRIDILINNAKGYTCNEKTGRGSNCKYKFRIVKNVFTLYVRLYINKGCT